MNPPKRTADYWMRHGSQEDLFEHLQHLIMKDVLSGNTFSSFSTENQGSMASPRRSTQTTSGQAQMPFDPTAPPLQLNQHLDGTMINQEDQGFQNLMPIINSSQSQSHYLSLMLNFITDNITDLSAITSILDISKFVQNRRTPLVEEFALDSNLKEVVHRLTVFREQMRTEDGNGEEMEVPLEQMQGDRVPRRVFAAVTGGDKGVFSLVKPEYFREHFDMDLKTNLQDTAQIAVKMNELESTRVAVENSRLVELTDKFDLFLEMMAKLGQIDAIIKRQVETISALRKKNGNLAHRIRQIKEHIIKKVRRKMIIEKALKATQAISLYKDSHHSLVAASTDYDYNRMCALVTKCDNLYETNLKDIKLVQRLKSEIDFTKKNFHMKLKSVVLETLSSLINAVIQLRSQEEIERYKAETTKILQESMNNKTFASPSEISTKVAEHVKEHLKVVKVEMAKNSSPAMLGSTNTSELSANTIFSYDISLGIRKALLAELEKICSAFFSSNIDFNTLLELTKIASNIQSKFSEDISKVICQKLTENQLMVLGSEAMNRMQPQKGVMMTVDELLLNWVGGYYQHTYQLIKGKLESDNWNSAELEDKTADLLEFIMHIDKPHPEEESFYVVKKKVVYKDQQYHLSNSFLALVEAVHSFMSLIFKARTAQFQLAMKMVELVTFYVTYLEELILAGKALDFKIIQKINTKVISLTIVEVDLLKTILCDKHLELSGLSQTQKEQVTHYFMDMRENLDAYSRNGRKKIVSILKDITVKSAEKFIEFAWDDQSIQVHVPLNHLSAIINSFQQIKQQMQSIFKEFLQDLDQAMCSQLEKYSFYSKVSGPRLKEQLNWMLKSLKELYVKMDLSLEEFEVKIKELIYSKCQFGEMGDTFDAFDDLNYGSNSPTSGMGMGMNMGSPSLNSTGFQQDPEEIQRQQRFREKEELRLRDLQKKQVEEVEAKNERRSKAKITLTEMMKNLDSLKKSKARTDTKSPTNAGGKGVSWGLVTNSIALKNGDFPGTKDISRMRDAIVNKAKDEGSN